MCCPLDQRLGVFSVTETNVQSGDEKDLCNLAGVYDRGPKSLSERISRYFQRLELMEKIAEIVDEIFHLFKEIFKKHTNDAVYQTLLDLHDGAHNIEHVLHSFCFIGDFSRISSGNLFQDSEGNKLNWLRCLSRICHAAAHALGTLKFLNQLKLCPLQRFANTFEYASLITTIGYSLWTISLLWERYHNNFNEDIRIHFGGAVFEGFNFIREVAVLPQGIDYALSKLKAIAGIIHAWSVVQRLMPADEEIIEVTFDIPRGKSKNDLSRPDNQRHHCSNLMLCAYIARTSSNHDNSDSDT